MSVVVLASASGAPGVTTTALGLALSWPGSSVLVDADRSMSQAIPAGYLSAEAVPSGGLTEVLQAHRERRPLAEALVEAWSPLPDLPRRAGEAPGDRRFVPGFSRLGAVDLFEGVWPGLVEATRSAPWTMVVDAGRTGHRGLPSTLVAEADAVGLVCRTSLQALAALPHHLGPLVEAGAPGRVGLVLVGPGRPYSGKEVAAQFGVPVLAEIAWDPSAAAELHSGRVGRRWGRSALGTSLAKAASSLAANTSAGHLLEEAS